MASQIETLLRVVLAQNADYNTKQLLKSGDFAQAAVQAIRQKRKSLVRLRLFMFSFLLMPVVLDLVARVVFDVQEPGGAQYGFFAMLALMQIPQMVDQRASVTRLETLLSMWLLTENDGITPDDNVKTTVLELLTPGL